MIKINKDLEIYWGEDGKAGYGDTNDHRSGNLVVDILFHMS